MTNTCSQSHLRYSALLLQAGLTLAIYGLISSLAGWAGAVLQRPMVQRGLRIVAGRVITGLGLWGVW